MNNNFLYALAKKLIFFTSYKDISSIIDDYNDFYSKGNVTETPGDIAKQMDKSKLVFMYIFSVYIISIIMFVFLSYMDGFLLKNTILVWLSFLFPIIITFLLGKKIRFISSLYSCNIKDKILSYVLNLLIALVNFINILIVYHLKDIDKVMSFITILNIWKLILILSFILFGIILILKGLNYYILLCNIYSSICTLFQISLFKSQLIETKEEIIYGIVNILLSYIISIIIISICFIFNKKYIKKENN